jgi:hypothetical protein
MSKLTDLLRDNPEFASLDSFHMQRLSEMDWSVAPEKATHYSVPAGNYCSKDGWWDKDGQYTEEEWLLGEMLPPRFFARPV